MTISLRCINPIAAHVVFDEYDSLHVAMVSAIRGGNDKLVLIKSRMRIAGYLLVWRNISSRRTTSGEHLSMRECKMLRDLAQV